MPRVSTSLPSATPSRPDDCSLRGSCVPFLPGLLPGTRVPAGGIGRLRPRNGRSPGRSGDRPILSGGCIVYAPAFSSADKQASIHERGRQPLRLIRAEIVRHHHLGASHLALDDNMLEDRPPHGAQVVLDTAPIRSRQAQAPSNRFGNLEPRWVGTPLQQSPIDQSRDY